MGASILWKPVKPGRAVWVGGRSAFISALELPRVLTEGDKSFLRGVGAGNQDYKGACDELIEAIEKHGEIEVYAEY